MVYSSLSKELHHPFEEPSNELKDKIKKILDEDPERNEVKLKIIQEWWSKNENFPKYQCNNLFKTYLRGTKFDIEKTKRKLENYYFNKHLFPQIYTNYDPTDKKIELASKNTNIAFFPKLTEYGERIFVARIENPDVDQFDIESIVKLLFMCVDISIRSETPITGYIVIMDCQNFTGAHFMKLFTHIFKAALQVAWDSLAIRTKKIFVINAPSALEKMLNLIRALLNEKLKQRMCVYQNDQIIRDNFSPDILPKNYGGDLPCLKEMTKDWYCCLVKNADWFNSQENIKITSTENKKHSSCNRDYNALGIGSFRKLAID